MQQTQEVQIVEVGVWGVLRFLFTLTALLSLLALVVWFAYMNRKPFFVVNSTSLSMEQFLFEKHSMIVKVDDDPGKKGKLQKVFHNVIYIYSTLLFHRNSFLPFQSTDDGVVFVSDYLTLVFTNDLNRASQLIRTEIEAD
jgi:hypothetical protein